MIVFEPKEHRYFNAETKDEYKSVSSVISQFKPKFDSDKWSKFIAEKEGRKQEDILRQWDTIRDTANEKGKRIHKLIENYLVDGKSENTPFFKNFLNSYNSEKEENSLVFSEKILFNHQYKIAGTSDIIEDCGRYFNVFDLKTNKKFSFCNKYNERMLHPLEHLSVCEYTSYSIQLSLYAYMFSSMTGKHVGKLKIFYNNEDNWYVIPIGYMKDTIEKILPLIK